MAGPPPRSGAAGSDQPEGEWSAVRRPRTGYAVVALRAAQLGIVLRHLEVTAESESDHRGILGLDEAVPAGPLDVRVTVRVAAEGVSEKQLRELVHWAELHSPVGDALRRAVPLRVDVVTS